MIGDKDPDADFQEVWKRCLDQAAGKTPARELTPDEEWRANWNAANGRTDPNDTPEYRAFQAWSELERDIGPGGVFANVSEEQKLELRAACLHDHGPKPEVNPADVAATIQGDTAARAEFFTKLNGYPCDANGRHLARHVHGQARDGWGQR